VLSIARQSAGAEGIPATVAPKHHPAARSESRLADAEPSPANGVSQRCRRRSRKSSVGRDDRRLAVP